MVIEYYKKNKRGLRVGVLNVNGLASTTKYGLHKRQAIFNEMRDDGADIICLVDTHLIQVAFKYN